jgi:hypothetical protein
MSASSSSPPSPKRRWLLKAALGLAAVGGVLGGGIWWRRGIDGTSLTADGRTVFHALARGIVGPMLPQDATKRSAMLSNYLHDVEKLVQNLPEAKRLQIGMLIGLLANAPTRYALASLGQSWDKASDDEVRAALEHLRTTGTIAHQVAFDACRKVIALSFFSVPENQSLTPYPGPMQI